MVRHKIETQSNRKAQKQGSSPHNLPTMPKYGSTLPRLEGLVVFGFLAIGYDEDGDGQRASSSDHKGNNRKCHCWVIEANLMAVYFIQISLKKSVHQTSSLLYNKV